MIKDELFSDSDAKRIDSAAKNLGEFYDSVAIFVYKKSDDGEREATSVGLSGGSYPIIELCRRWINRMDQQDIQKFIDTMDDEED